MSDTYIAWDGNSYPSPPPDGWYHASDGRWWAPGTGPGPLATAAPPVPAPQFAPAPQPAPVAQPVVTADTPTTVMGAAPVHGVPADRTTAFPPGYGQAGPPPGSGVQPGYIGQPAPGQYSPPPGSGAAGQPGPGQYSPPAGLGNPPGYAGQPGPGQAGPPPGLGGPPPGFGHPAPGQYNPPPGPGLGSPPPGGPLGPNQYAPGPQQGVGPIGFPSGGSVGSYPGQTAKSGGPGRLAAVMVGLFALILVAAGAYLLANRNKTTTSAASTSTTAAGSATSTTAKSGATTATTAKGATTAAGGGSTTTAKAGATSTTLTADAAQQVTQFRGILTAHGLTSNELSDSDVQEFASTFCIYARSAQTPEEFGTLRDQAVSDSNSSLDKTSLNLVINAAVVVFCPSEATRLGVKV